MPSFIDNVIFSFLQTVKTFIVTFLLIGVTKVYHSTLIKNAFLIFNTNPLTPSPQSL